MKQYYGFLLDVIFVYGLIYMEKENTNVLIDSAAIGLFESRADELIIDATNTNTQEKLLGFTKSIDQGNFVFDDAFIEARYFYTLANCYSELYRYHTSAWYSEDLGIAIVNYRKALYVVMSIEYPNANHQNLRSRIETNLANYLSRQGRAICALEHWNNALDIDLNPVAMIAKATNALFLAENIYDEYHVKYHYYEAYKLICLGLEHIELLEENHKSVFDENSNFMRFKIWFEERSDEKDFANIQGYKEDFKSQKQKQYLKWCGDNRLFFNELNDYYTTELVYTDCFTLPSFTQAINRALTQHEDLVYHGNFDEIKNDYCYARYLFFSSINIPNEQEHFFNETYEKVDDFSHSLTNLKAQHYKSSFKALYSIFDKIAYFLNSFYDLNKIDSKVYFHNIFGQMKDGKLKPHRDLANSDNYFLHALFYILKDIRDSNPKSTERNSEAYWLDPDAVAFAKIRNAMEHCSLKIVDDFGDSLSKSDILFHQHYLDELIEKKGVLENQLTELYSELSKAKKERDVAAKASLEEEMLKLNKDLTKTDSAISDKEKRSNHSLLITDEKFEERLLDLMKLVRSSIVYLSLAINLDEKRKPKNGVIAMPMSVPLKSDQINIE